MLYPYLPEPMRNPQTFEFMLNDPAMRQQLEAMVAQQVGRGGAIFPTLQNGYTFNLHFNPLFLGLQMLGWGKRG